ncbi:isoprenylcysteine carboxylmethyltransferase family protein [bacterium]|nr:isoprenylcysteine carboxylmethyltransferase family protein [bacterium]
MFVLWFSWFQMCLLDPTILPVPGWIRGLGLFLFVAGVFLFVFSHTKMKGFEGRGVLIKTGIYSRIRNPMYLGFIIWIIGFPLFMRKMLSSLSSVIWIVHILVWKFLEEKELEKKYPEYGEYKARTWF